MSGNLMVNIRPVLSLALSVSFLGIAMAGEPLGLVLSGGAAKGAYEVGVWQALVEADLADDITAISGTSVGAINAALFASVREPLKCVRLWENEIGSVFQFNTNLLIRILGEEGKTKVEHVYAQMRKNIMEDMVNAAIWRRCEVAELPREIKDKIEEDCESVARKRLFLELPKMKTFTSMLYDYDESRSMEGFLPIKRLYSLLLRELPKSWECGAPAVYATALRKEGDSPSIVTFAVKKACPEERAAMICASACLPFLFGAYEVNGATYNDGGVGGGDNVPIGIILERYPEIKTVIVVFLDDEDNIRPGQRNRVRSAARTAGVQLVEVIPSKDINGTFGICGYIDDSKETVRDLIELGRQDTREALVKAGLWWNEKLRGISGKSASR